MVGWGGGGVFLNGFKKKKVLKFLNILFLAMLIINRNQYVQNIQKKVHHYEWITIGY